MTRAEVVDVYRTLWLTGQLWEHLWRRHFVLGLGELHDPEFAVCLECGVEFEVAFNGLPRGGWLSRRGEFCVLCQGRHRRDCAARKAEWPGLVRAA